MRIKIAFMLALVAGAVTTGWSKPGAHGDHTSKHGGQFFMAPNGIHHLEGALKGNQLRIYLYDAHTHPVSATPFLTGARAQLERKASKPLDLKAAALADKSEYLFFTVPDGMTKPLEFSVWLVFPRRTEPELFNFTFEK